MVNEFLFDSYFLENGEVYSWGSNLNGQLGHYYETRGVPTLISFFKGMNVVDIFAFSCESYILLGK